MAKFKIGDDEYQTGKLNAFDQLKVMKRLVEPFNKIMSPDLLKQITADVKAGGVESDLMRYLGAFAEAAATIKDDDLEFIIMKCCSVCERRHADVWAPVLVPGSSIFAFPDLGNDSAKLIRIAYEVVVENLSGFFSALPSTLGLGESAAPTILSSTSPTKHTG